MYVHYEEYLIIYLLCDADQTEIDTSAIIIDVIAIQSSTKSACELINSS